MDLGAGLAVCGCAFAFAAISMTLISNIFKRPKTDEEEEVCPLHSGVNIALEFIQKRLDNFEEKMDQGFTALHQDIKNILIKIGS